MMSQRTDYVVRRRLRSPRSAAIAGIIYSILMTTGMVLVYNITRDLPEDITKDWLDAWSDRASVALTLVPFAGIAFLWFTGVVRDRLGEHEDQLFATIFLSSGIITVVLFFVWAAIFAALMRTTSLAAVGLADDDVYVFGFALMNRIVGDYALRMAGVYMMAIGTIWTRSGIMPRWMTIITYVLALGFLLAAGWAREARFIFPVWVFVVSIYILILNYRSTHEQTGSDGLTVVD
jgi:MFS family permease